MQATKKRKISIGNEFDYLFPIANRDTHTILKSAEVSDTVAFIPKVVHKTLFQTEKLAKVLKDENEYETCRNIWEFVYKHIAYDKDKDGYEQIRSPSRTWHDRSSGVDCDCYSTFISSLLNNLSIRHKLRITKYNHDYFQHIYPIAILKNGRQVPIDCVTEQFDYEVPYKQKKDYQMELQYLDGIEGAENLDYVRYAYGEEVGDLGRHKKKKHHKDHSHKSHHEDFEDFMEHGDTMPGYGVRKKKGVKKLLNFVNKLNPATTLLRNGVLASTKLNIAKVGGKLRWTYLTPNQAKAKGMDMERWKKLVQIRQKLDNIFYGAGGKPENLKKAIIKGKGNKDKTVHGLDDVGDFHHNHLQHDHNRHANHHDFEENGYEFSKNTPLKQLLGSDIYHNEHEALNTLGELGDLGEPVTMAAIASAAGVVAAIAKMLKKVGDVFRGKGKGSSDFNDHKDENGDSVSDEDGGSKNGDNSNDSNNSKDGDSSKDEGSSSNGDNSNGDNSGGDSKKDIDGNSMDLMTTKSGHKSSQKLSKKGSTEIETDETSGSGSSGGGGETGVKGFIEKNKKWLLPAAAGIGGITAIAVGYHAFAGNHKGKPLSGTHHNKKPKTPLNKTQHTKGKGKHKGKKGKITKTVF